MSNMSKRQQHPILNCEFMRVILRVVMVTLLTLSDLPRVQGHAKMTEPPMRATMWRYGFPTPVNYDDNELFCGGLNKFILNEGRCGTCGDAYDDPTPAHEAGGAFATGIIVRYFPAGASRIPVSVDVTAFHKGYFEFRLCANNNVTKRVEQECLDKQLLYVEEGYPQGDPYRYYPDGLGVWNGTVRVPEGMICTQCVLQMTYKAGNNWGKGHNDTEHCLGCGYQEQFQNCADISIGYPEPPSTTTSTTTTSSTSYDASSTTPSSNIVSSSDVTGPTSEPATTQTSTGHARTKVTDVNNKEIVEIHSLTNIDKNDRVLSPEIQQLEQSEMILTDIEQRVGKLERSLLPNVHAQRVTHLEDVELKKKLGHMMIKMKRLEGRMKFMEKIIDIMNAKITILEPIVDVVNTNQRLIHGLLMRSLAFPPLHGVTNNGLERHMNDRTIARHMASLESKGEIINKGLIQDINQTPSNNKPDSHARHVKNSTDLANEEISANNNDSTISAEPLDNVVKGFSLKLTQNVQTFGKEETTTVHVPVTENIINTVAVRENSIEDNTLYNSVVDPFRNDVRMAQYVEQRVKNENASTRSELLENKTASITNVDMHQNAKLDKENQSYNHLRSLGPEKPLIDVLLQRFPAISAWMEKEEKQTHGDNDPTTVQ